MRFSGWCIYIYIYIHRESIPHPTDIRHKEGRRSVSFPRFLIYWDDNQWQGAHCMMISGHFQWQRWRELGWASNSSSLGGGRKLIRLNVAVIPRLRRHPHLGVPIANMGTNAREGAEVHSNLDAARLSGFQQLLIHPKASIWSDTNSFWFILFFLFFERM